MLSLFEIIANWIVLRGDFKHDSKITKRNFIDILDTHI